MALATNKTYEEKTKAAMQQAKANDKKNVDAAKRVPAGTRVSGSNSIKTNNQFTAAESAPSSAAKAVAQSSAATADSGVDAVTGAAAKGSTIRGFSPGAEVDAGYEAPDALTNLGSKLRDLLVGDAKDGENVKRQAQQRGRDYLEAIPAAIQRGADTLYTGTTGLLDMFIGQPLQALGWENNPVSAWNESAQREAEGNAAKWDERIDDSGARLVSDVGSQVVAAIPDAVLALFTGGGSVAAQGTRALQAADAARKAAGTVSGASRAAQTARAAADAVSSTLSNPSYWTSFARTAGNNFNEARAQGADSAKATAYATINGLIGAMVEVGGGGIQSLPGKLRTNPGQLRAWVDSMIDEGKEEVVQGVIDRLAQNVTYNAGNQLFSTTDPNAVFNLVTAAQEFGMGAAVGGILGGGQILLNNAANGRRTQTQREMDAVDAFLEAAGVNTRRPSTEVAPESAPIQEATQSPVSDFDAQTSIDTANGINADTAQQGAQTARANTETSVVEQLRGAIPRLQNIAPVAEVQGNELPQGNRLIDRLVSFAESIGNRVTRAGFGDVLFSRSRIKNSMLGHGVSPAKIETFAAVPAVIQNGAQIGSAPNWKGRGYDTYIFAAPVNYRGTPTYLAAVVTRDTSDGRYYLHEVINEDGSLISANENQQETTSDGRASQTGTVDTVSSPADNNSISSAGANVNAREMSERVASEATADNSNTARTPIASEPTRSDNGNSQGTGYNAENNSPVHNAQSVPPQSSFSSAPETIKTVVPSQSEARGGSGALFNNSIPSSGQNVNPESSTGAAPRGFSVGHAPEVVQNQEHAIEGVLGDELNTPGEHERLSNRDSLYYAQQRLDLDYDGEVEYLMDRASWDAVDVDVAHLILQNLVNEAKRTGDRTDLNDWLKVMRPHATEAGQDLQAYSKWANNPARVYADAVEFLDGPNARKMSEAKKEQVLDSISGALDRLEALDTSDTAGTIDLIKSLSQLRGTNSLLRNRMSGTMDAALNYVARNVGDGPQFLRDVAATQIRNVAADYAKVSTGDRAKTIRTLNLLSKPATTFRNLVGNGVFDPLESIANNTGVVFDIMLSPITGQRTVAFDRGLLSAAKRRGSLEGAMKSFIEVGLDADSRNIENRYESGTGRTFKMSGNFIERLLSTWEKYNGYMLTTTDEMAKGGTRAEARRGLEALQQRQGSNITDDYVTERADEIARQRTFQNDSAAADLMLRGRDALNALHVGNIGAGDVLVPFARVPANVAMQGVNYSPVGIVNGVAQMARTIEAAQRGTLTPEQQATAVTALGRGLTGTAGVAAFAALALKGLLRVSESDDADEKAFDSMEGLTGTQLNLSALGRALNGESAEWRDGDNIMSIGFLEPVNAIMAMGSMIADSYKEDESVSARDMLNASLQGVVQAVLDLPAMSSIQELMDAWQYADGDDLTDRTINAAMSYAGSQLPSFFIPNVVAGVAQGLDSVVRAPYLGETAEQDAVNQFLADIPGLRSQTPAQLTPWGTERTYGDDPIRNLLNSTILPGYLNEYQTNEVNREIRRLGNVYPSRQAPSSFSVNGETLTLTQAQKDTYQRAYGQAAFDSLSALMGSATYQSMSDEERTKTIESIYDYAKDLAKQAVSADYELKSKNAEAQGFAGGPAEYFLFDNAWKTIEDSKGTDTTAFEAVMQDYSNMSAEQQDAVKTFLGENSRFDDVVEAYQDGVSPADWFVAYDKYKEINATEGLTANDKATEFAKWLDESAGVTPSESELFQDQFAFYSMMRADSERYDALRSAGFSPTQAYDVYDAVSALVPAPGKSQVSNQQRYEAIVGLDTLSEQEKVAALTEYEAKGNSDRLKFETLYDNYGVSPDLYVDMLALEEAGYGDADKNGSYKQAEAKTLIDHMLDTYDEMTNSEAAVLWAMLCTSSKRNNPYGDVYYGTMNWARG